MKTTAGAALGRDRNVGNVCARSDIAIADEGIAAKSRSCNGCEVAL